MQFLLLKVQAVYLSICCDTCGYCQGNCEILCNSCLKLKKLLSRWCSDYAFIMRNENYCQDNRLYRKTQFRISCIKYIWSNLTAAFLCVGSPQCISKLQTSFFGKQQKRCISSILLLIYLRKKVLKDLITWTHS